MNSRYKTVFLGVAVFLACCLVACSGGRKVTPPQEVPPSGRPIGEDSVSVTLNRAALSGYTLEASFTVVNRGNDDLSFDPEAGFAAKGTLGTREEPLELDVNACQGRLLKGTVPASGELTGDLCWKADPTGTAPEMATITYGTAASISSWEVEAE